MANPTSNFNWQMPTASDLVTDLPADFEVFGQAVDTSLADLKGGTTGQVLSKTSGTDMDFTWVTTDDANAIQNAIVDAKGDLIAASANDTPARLAVGNNGETLVADSSTSTGLRYKEDYAAGKNKIINGDFLINQRAFTSTTSGSTYTFDRWAINVSDGTVTNSAQTFTLGAAPVAGYEGKNYLRCVTTGQTLTTARANLIQPIESVRTFAGQTVTLSFWAKAATGTPEIGCQLQQMFGTGGSPSASVNTTSKVTISTSWARYSVTLNLPSISGKTLGTDNNDRLVTQFWFSGGSDFTALSGGIGLQSNTFEIWGVQLEAGSVATAFQTATGTIQGELAACQRYFQIYPTGADAQAWSGQFYSTTAARLYKDLPVTMRTSSQTITLPTGTFTNFIEQVGVATRTPTTLTAGSALANRVYFDATGMSSATSGAMAVWAVSNQISINAEL
jgi:hypothetical protein